MLNTEKFEKFPVKGFEGLYFITPDGKVYNHKKQLNTHKINSGYLTVTLSKDKVSKPYLVHRLVALTFLENPLNKRTVNHKDGDKLNNNLENLEWATYSENKRHAFREGITVYNKPTKGLRLKPRTATPEKSKRSKYSYVYYIPSRNKWLASVHLNGKTIGQKRFNCEVEAALHVNKILDEYGIHDRPRNIVS